MELRQENHQQNRRLENVERLAQETRDEVHALKVALIGINGDNGFRGDQLKQEQKTRESINEIKSTIDKIVPTILKAIAAIIASFAGLAGVVYGAARLLTM